MANRGGELHSARVDVASGRRSYFFNIKADRNGAFFMTIVESTKRHDNGFIRNEIFLYEEDINQFSSEFMNTLGQFRKIVNAQRMRSTNPTATGQENAPDEKTHSAE